MYYDMVISEVKRDVKAEDVTFNLKLMLRLNTLLPRVEAESSIKVKSHVGLSKIWIFVCIYMHVCNILCVCAEETKVCL